MQAPRPRLTVFRLILAVAVLAIILHLATEGANDRERQRSERCLVIADNHARMGDNYRVGARGDKQLSRIASWHDHMRRVFEEAAARPGAPVPTSRPFPPEGWRSPH